MTFKELHEGNSHFLNCISGHLAVFNVCVSACWHTFGFSVAVFSTCRAPNNIISSSVQSMSSSRMAQRACSYSWFRRTTSYYTARENRSQIKSGMEWHIQTVSIKTIFTHKHLRIYIIEGKVFEAKPDSVIFLDALLHETTGWVQPPWRERK